MGAYLSASLSHVNTHELRHALTGQQCNAPMKTIEEIRRLRLVALREEAGSWVELNRRLGMIDRDSTFSQIFSARTKKGMGSDLARRLEAAFGKEAGWMDNDPDLDSAQWPFGEDVPISAVQKLPADLAAEARGMLRWLLSQAASREAESRKRAATGT